eukprot:s7057_g1.t1
MEQRRAEQEKLERERGEQKENSHGISERTAVLTLEDLTMDTVAMHTEDVFKLKFIRSIAEALQIPKHRVKVRALPPDEDFCVEFALLDLDRVRLESALEPDEAPPRSREVRSVAEMHVAHCHSLASRPPADGTADATWNWAGLRACSSVLA